MRISTFILADLLEKCVVSYHKINTGQADFIK